MQFASLEPGDRMRRPAIIANTRHNAHTLSPSQNLPLFWLWGKMCGIERWKKNQEAWKLCGGFPVCAYNNITQGIESITQIIMHEFKNQALESKTQTIFAAKTGKKSNVSAFSLCPLLCDLPSHLVHLPVVLLVHHHLNDNHHHPNSPTTYIVADIITLHQCPTFPATLAPPYRPP